MKKYIIVYQNEEDFGLLTNKNFDRFEDAQIYMRTEFCKSILNEEKSFRNSNINMLQDDDSLIDILISILEGEEVFRDHFSSYSSTAYLATGGRNDITYKIETIEQ